MVDLAGVATPGEIAALGEKLDALEDAVSIDHNKGSLLAHLVGVWRVLRSGGANTELTDAGLIHSVYSTQFFKQKLFEESDRHKVAETFGAHSENIAWLFCTIDRSSLWATRPPYGFFEDAVAFDYRTRRRIQLEADIANDLFALECANFIDQGYQDRSVGPFHAWALSLVERGVGLDFKTNQSPCALAEEEETLAIDSYLSSSGTFADAELLQLASRLNPLAAEPLIIEAALNAADCRFVEAHGSLMRALDLLPTFGASWDKRLTWPEWVAIVDALGTSVAERKPPLIGSCLTNPADLRNWAIEGNRSDVISRK